MPETIRRYREWINAPTLVRRKWWIGVNTALAVLYFGGGLGLYRDNNRREDQAHRAQFEECLRRADSRIEIRGMFLTTFEVIEETTGNPDAFDAVRARLDVRYPPLDADAC